MSTQKVYDPALVVEAMYSWLITQATPDPDPSIDKGELRIATRSYERCLRHLEQLRQMWMQQ